MNADPDPWKSLGLSEEDREQMVTRPLRYPEYSGVDVPCPKCGARRVDTIHQPATPPCLEFDWLDRVCHTCGFDWPERCINPERVAPDDGGER